ncbi:MAG: tRNA threonylcarbamoyladenosine dehydratase [Bacteroidia bacterium]|nr:tRNA threonylcarbamoyladenosine dehydratase [Bacteroidia bacterium]
MMDFPQWMERTQLLLGDQVLERFHSAHVLVVGLGGVGAYAAEQLCRAGIGSMTIADGDTVQPGNRNRQLPALRSTEGQLKAEVMAERLLDINPELKLRVLPEFIRDEALQRLMAEAADYVVDAIDTLSPKVWLIEHALRNGHRVVSSLGAGGKTDPTLVRIDDIERSHHCRLGKMLRKRLHRLGVRRGVTVVYSTEGIAPEAMQAVDDERNKKTIVGTISYMPPLFGCLCASVVLRALADDVRAPDAASMQAPA